MTSPAAAALQPRDPRDFDRSDSGEDSRTTSGYPGDEEGGRRCKTGGRFGVGPG